MHMPYRMFFSSFCVGLSTAALAAPPAPQPVPSVVVNGPSSPVPVTDVNKDKPRQFFQRAMNTEVSEPFATMTVDVPEGKVLVIERVSFRVEVPAGQKATANAFGNCSFGAGNVQVPLASQGVFNGTEILTGTVSAQLLAGGAGITTDQDVLLSAVRTGNTGTMFLEASITGYYLDATN